MHITNTAVDIIGIIITASREILQIVFGLLATRAIRMVCHEHYV